MWWSCPVTPIRQFSSSSTTRVAEDLVVRSLVPTILRVLETALAQSVQQELECKAGRGHRAALLSLLSQLCNAAVKLDYEFKFVDDAAHFHYCSCDQEADRCEAACCTNYSRMIKTGTSCISN